MEIKRDWVCPECNGKSIGGMVHLNCKEKYSLDGLVSLLSYRGLVRMGVKELKYRMIKEIEKDMSSIFAMSIKERIKTNQAQGLVDFLKSRPVVVPMPLYWRRENWRGFNQAEVVAKMLERGFSLELVSDWLVRVRETKEQMRLSKSERVSNVRGVFSVKNKYLDGQERNLTYKRVLLVDDVWTTGSTMREAGRVLKKAGVEQVWGLTLAR